ncbi:MAG: hypothetical protein RIR65_1396 [Planctomycetota bacterium]|jgi:predicted amidophosphoribosyltransferase
MPRLLKARRCPHCKERLAQPPPRVCPACAGSLQQRHLALGCLTSAPKVVLAAWGLSHLARAAWECLATGTGPG